MESDGYQCTPTDITNPALNLWFDIISIDLHLYLETVCWNGLII